MQINLSAPINQLSYGLASTNILKALSDLGHEVSLFPIGPVQITQEDVEYIQNAANRAQFFNNTAPSLRIFHQFALAESIGWGARVAMPIFELTEFNDVEKHHLNSVEYVFVCSDWAKQVVLSQTGHHEEDVFVIPLGVDTSIFNPIATEPITRESGTSFLCVGKYEVRKGMAELCEAFNAAFDPSDDVWLVLHCHNPFFSAEETAQFIDMFKKSKMGHRIQSTADRNLSHQQVAQLMRIVDCGVFPSKAEGWNLPALECLAVGLPIIVTDYGAHKEFCTPENSLLISVDNLELAYDGKWFTSGVGEWAEFGEHQVNQLVHHMRAIHRRKEAGEELFNQAGVDTAEGLTWAHTAQHIAVALAEITGQSVESRLCIGSEQQ